MGEYLPPLIIAIYVYEVCCKQLVNYPSKSLRIALDTSPRYVKTGDIRIITKARFSLRQTNGEYFILVFKQKHL